MLALGLPGCSNPIGAYAEAVVHDLNHRPRPRLNGRTSCQVFFESGHKPAFTKRERGEIYDCVTEKAEKILPKVQEVKILYSSIRSIRILPVAEKTRIILCPMTWPPLRMVKVILPPEAVEFGLNSKLGVETAIPTPAGSVCSAPSLIQPPEFLIRM